MCQYLSLDLHLIGWVTGGLHFHWLRRQHSLGVYQETSIAVWFTVCTVTTAALVGLPPKVVTSSEGLLVL